MFSKVHVGTEWSGLVPYGRSLGFCDYSCFLH